MPKSDRILELLPLLIAVIGLGFTSISQNDEIAKLKQEVKTLQVEVQSIEFVKKWGEHERTVDR